MTGRSPHLHRYWGSSLPHLHQDWGSPLPHLRRDWATPMPHLRRDWAHPVHICAGTGAQAQPCNLARSPIGTSDECARLCAEVRNQRVLSVCRGGPRALCAAVSVVARVPAQMWAG